LSFYGSTLLIQFLGGMTLSAVVSRLPKVRRGTGLVLITFAFAALFTCEAARLEPRGLIYGIPAVVIVAVAVALERARKLPKWPLAGLLGDASYSIYLTHVFVIAGSRIFFSAAGLKIDRYTGYAFVPFALLTSCIVGVAVHFLLERPLIAFANSLVRRKEKTSSALKVAAS
jgi:exopolysaccharide production protein ExoZ